MLKSSVRLGILALAALACACFTPPPVRDPLAGLDLAPADPALKRLTVGLIVSDNTRQTLEYVAKTNAQFSKNSIITASPPYPELQPKIDDFIAFMQKTFKAAVRVDTDQNAQAAGVDALAVLDMHVDHFPASIFEGSAFSWKTVFLTPARSPIAEASGYWKTAARGAFSAVRPSMEDAIDRSETEMKKRIASLAPLIDYARSRSKRAEAVAEVPAPAPSRVSDVDAPSYHSDENTDDFALVIGIEKYANLPAADFAERDAAAVRRHLLALGYPQRNIVTLTGSQATKTGIEKYVETWLPRKVGADSRVLVYYSGHGAPEPATGQAYLVPWDGDAKFLENTGYPLKKLYEKLNALRAKQVIVAMDSCFSGLGGRSVLAKGVRPLVNKVDVGISAAGRLVVLTATASDEIAGTEESQGHGLFTYYLLKGLNATHGQSAVRPLYQYLLPKVQDAARQDNRDQNPQMTAPAAGEAAASLR